MIRSDFVNGHGGSAKIIDFGIGDGDENGLTECGLAFKNGAVLDAKLLKDFHTTVTGGIVMCASFHQFHTTKR